MFSFLKAKSSVPDFVMPENQTSTNILQTPNYIVEDRVGEVVVVTNRYTKTSFRLTKEVLEQQSHFAELLLQTISNTVGELKGSMALITRNEEDLVLDWASNRIFRNLVLTKISGFTLGILVNKERQNAGDQVIGVAYVHGLLSHKKKNEPGFVGSVSFTDKYGRSLTYFVTTSYFFDGKTVVGFDFTLEK